MIIKKVPDIKLRCYDDTNHLIWKSLRNENIKAGEGWRTILPKKYRLSYNGYWYELNPLDVEMYLAWAPYLEAGVPTDIQIIWKVPTFGKVPEKIYATLTKSDESNPTLQDKVIDINEGYIATFRPIQNYTLNPLISSYLLDNNKELSTSVLAKYTINTNKVVLPYMNLSVKNMSFPSNETSIESNIILYSGDTQFAEGVVPSNLTFEIESYPNWLKSVTPSTGPSNTLLTVTCNTIESSVSNSGSIVIKCKEYPFIKATIQCTQDITIIDGSEMIDAEYLILRGQWTYASDFDFVFYCDNYAGITEAMGYYSSTRVFADALLDPSGIVWWGGDITNVTADSFTGKRNETFIILVHKLKEMAEQLPDVVDFYLYGSWWSLPDGLTEGDVTCTWNLYKGNVILGTYSHGNQTVVNTIPPNNFPTIERQYCKPIQYDTEVSNNTTINCYKKTTSQEPYINQITTSLGNKVSSTYYTRPLVKIQYFKNEDKIVVISLKNGRV